MKRRRGSNTMEKEQSELHQKWKTHHREKGKSGHLGNFFLLLVKFPVKRRKCDKGDLVIDYNSLKADV